MKNNPVIFVSTCEFSGDMHGEVLVNELRKILPEATFYGVGGSKMAEAGVELVYDPTCTATVGFTEVLRNLRRLKRLVREITEMWDRRRPDVMLWLDSGGFNLVLAKEAKKRQIPVVCMFSPSAWAYGEDRAVKMAQRIRLLLAVLPFEADFYRKFGVETIYVGHPLFDRVQNQIRPDEYRLKMGIKPGERLLALMPGSRRQEVANLLPLMLEAVTRLSQTPAGDHGTIKAVIPLAASINREWMESIIRPYPVSVELITDNTYDLLAATDAAIIASGTATLEAAILNTPAVVVYRISKISYLIYKMLESKEHKSKPWLVALPNLIAGRQIMPEMIQENLTVENIVKALQPLLFDEQENLKIRGELSKIRDLIGPSGVMTRAAGIIGNLLKEDKII